MRLLNNSNTRSVFESITNDDVNKAINDAFYGTDFIITSIDNYYRKELPTLYI